MQQFLSYQQPYKKLFANKNSKNLESKQFMVCLARAVVRNKTAKKRCCHQIACTVHSLETQAAIVHAAGQRNDVV